MKYEPQNFESLIGIAGLSDRQLNDHFALYQGYVANTNKISEQLMEYLASGQLSSPQYAELKRHFAWEFDGMRLHELYFSNLSKIPFPSSETSLYQLLEKEFNGFDHWRDDFIATGNIRGIGWVILYYDPSSQRLFNVWINEHNTNHLPNAVPLLVMDVFEHAYMIDYGIKRADYINTFMSLIHWGVVSDRFEHAAL
jgi:Fe-Mn family superoxide dismutase